MWLHVERGEDPDRSGSANKLPERQRQMGGSTIMDLAMIIVVVVVSDSEEAPRPSPIWMLRTLAAVRLSNLVLPH